MCQFLLYLLVLLDHIFPVQRIFFRVKTLPLLFADAVFFFVVVVFFCCAMIYLNLKNQCRTVSTSVSAPTAQQ